MKKICLAASMFAVLAAIPATAVEFNFGADVVSRYVWRGIDTGDSPAVQPNMAASFRDGKLELGYWGSFATNAGGGNELDWYLTYNATDDISISITDYFFPTPGETEFSNADHHWYELSISATMGKIDLLAGFMTGELIENSIWLEGNYNFGDFNGVDFSYGLGIGTESYVAQFGKDTEISIVSQVNMAKGDYFASYIFNGQQDVNFMVFGRSF